VKLPRLEQWIEARRALAREYDRLLPSSSVTLPHAMPDARHVYCLYTIRTAGRDALQRGLEAAGIQSAVHYPLPIHLMPAYANARYKAGDFPVAEECAGTVLSLPLYSHLTAEQVGQVASEICSLLSKKVHEPVSSGR
jgi:dTDP-4-amino-4,6-dideoxygalactose transaminase